METPTQKLTQASIVKNPPQARVLPKIPQYQEASVIKVVENDAPPPSGQTKQKDGGLWSWYIGAAFLGALALLGIRLTQASEQKTHNPADDYEIIEETEDEEPR